MRLLLREGPGIGDHVDLISMGLGAVSESKRLCNGVLRDAWGFRPREGSKARGAYDSLEQLRQVLFS